MTEVIAEGKTKIVTDVPHPFAPERARLQSKDDTTAGDGKRHEVINGKAEISNRTAVNTFTLLKRCGFPVSFCEQDSPTSFIAYKLRMIPLEVVTRGIAWGSYLERNPKSKQGTLFNLPLVEFFLKTSDRQWVGKRRGDVFKLPCDDPLMVIADKDVWLYHAHEPFVKGMFIVHLDPEDAFPVSGSQALLQVMTVTNRALYETLSFAWQCVGARKKVAITFPDMKVEYGFDSLGRLWIGDVIDAESCRLLVDGQHASKQGFREGASVEQAKMQLGIAADLSDVFAEVADEVAAWVNGRYGFVSAESFPVSLT